MLSGLLSNLLDRTKLHEGIKLHEDTFAQEINLHEIKSHEGNFEARVTFAQIHYLNNLNLFFVFLFYYHFYH